jgi:BirA family biotin operon repressor/biotin-[acetyl-CoA-carboxylase] ligase
VNEAPDHSREVLAILADGLGRTPEALAFRLGATSFAIEATLARLVEAGLPLRREKIATGAVTVRIEHPFIALDALAISQYLSDLDCHAEVRVQTIIDSTNLVLLAQARGASDGLPETHLALLTAEMQTAGRGRLGRSWHAHAGSSLAVSFGRRLPRGLGELEGLSLMCGLAVRDAAQRAGATLELKWPNDLLWEDRKVGGILIEVHPLARASCALVIGVGLNIAPDPARTQALKDGATPFVLPGDLVAAGAPSPIDRNRLVADLADTLTLRLGQFLDAGFAPHVADWNAHHAYRDRAVEMLERGSIVRSGIARGVDAFGRLRLDTAAGTLHVIAGDVSLRPRRAP